MTVELVSGGTFEFFSSGDEIADMLRNAKLVLSTVRGSMPGSRDYGIDATWIDAPTPRAMAAMRAAIIDALARWEPRAKVVSIGFTAANAEGQIYPKVVIAYEPA